MTAKPGDKQEDEPQVGTAQVPAGVAAPADPLVRLLGETEEALLAHYDDLEPPSEMLEPLDAELEARLLQTVVAAQAPIAALASAERPSGAAAPRLSRPPAAAPASRGQGAVESALLRLQQWFLTPALFSRRIWVPTAAALLLGVAIAAQQGLLFGRREPLAAYLLDVQGEDQALGGPAAGAGVAEAPVQIHSDTVLDVIVRPQAAVNEPLEVVAYLRRDSWQPWPVTLVPHPGGVFQLRAQAQALPGLLPGSYEIALVVGRRGALPGLAQLLPYLERSQKSTASDWQLLRKQIQVKPQRP